MLLAQSSSRGLINPSSFAVCGALPKRKGPAAPPEGSKDYARFFKPSFVREPGWERLQRQPPKAPLPKPQPYDAWYKGQVLGCLKQQCEYYFSPQNLSKDEFLQKSIEQGGGWVPLSVVCRFPRMASLCAAQPGIVLQALEGSESVEVSVDKQQLRPKRM